MPQIDVHLINGVFNTEQKKQIIQKNWPMPWFRSKAKSCAA